VRRQHGKMGPTRILEHHVGGRHHESRVGKSPRGSVPAWHGQPPLTHEPLWGEALLGMPVPLLPVRERGRVAPQGRVVECIGGREGVGRLMVEGRAEGAFPPLPGILHENHFQCACGESVFEPFRHSIASLSLNPSGRACP